VRRWIYVSIVTVGIVCIAAHPTPTHTPPAVAHCAESVRVIDEHDLGKPLERLAAKCHPGATPGLDQQRLKPTLPMQLVLTCTCTKE